MPIKLLLKTRQSKLAEQFPVRVIVWAVSEEERERERRIGGDEVTDWAGEMHADWAAM